MLTVELGFQPRSQKLSGVLIKQRWGIELKTSKIYEILEKLNLSHQKAHRDYDNASPKK
ncbi:winged helix-turn-helix domain-containing protein [Microcoleus sp. herbarium5]|uniref:winged helix-turn-helix domain-containing protein n=1 Tax=Microcoleus sp. herbarium5 TaxID=3055434 RepID=UPI00403F334C